MKEYFTQKDFDKCSPVCKMSDMNPETIRKFNVAREIAGIPFIVNSAYRTEEHEKKNGRTGTSSHTKGCAMDIRCTDGNARYKIINALISAGITRIGVAGSYIHGDDDNDKPQNVVWTY